MTGMEAERSKITRDLKSELAAQMVSDSRSYQLMRSTILLAYGLALLLTGAGIILVRREIRYRMCVEAALREASEQLEKRVQVGTAELARQTDLLRAGNEARELAERSLREREAQLSTIFETGLAGN